MRRVIWEVAALNDAFYWAKQDRKVLARIIVLIEDIQKHPFHGLGRPEPLRHNLKGYWSRRINQEHRLVYSLDDEFIYIAQCRFHYDK